MDNSTVQQDQADPAMAAKAELNYDIVHLLFKEHLIADSKSFLNAALTCKTWHDISLPILLGNVDLSSHNNGRLPENDASWKPVACADSDRRYQRKSLISRQRAFLKLITARPDLAKHVKSFTWTLVWKEFEEDNLMEIDYQTWNVFERLTNVTKLDLASLHRVHSESIVRQSPLRLFSGVTDLRLLGWMHRGLVKSIFESIEREKLRSLKLDYLLDEGALPTVVIDKEKLRSLELEYLPNEATRSSRLPMPEYINLECAQMLNMRHDGNPVPARIISEKLYQRQKSGEVCIFPGPMWLPFRLLSTSPLRSLTSLDLKLPVLDRKLDIRNYDTWIQDSLDFITQVQESLETVLVCFGHSPYMNELRPPRNASSSVRQLYYRRTQDRPWCIRFAASFLRGIAHLLDRDNTNCAFAKLSIIRLEGFDVLRHPEALQQTHENISDIIATLSRCRQGLQALFTDHSHNRGRRYVFRGYDHGPRFPGLKVRGSTSEKMTLDAFRRNGGKWC